MPRITVTIAILLVSSFGLYSTQSKQLGEIDKRLIKYYAHKVGHTIFFKKISNPQGFNFRLFFIHDIEEARKRGEPYNGDLRLNRIVFTSDIFYSSSFYCYSRIRDIAHEYFEKYNKRYE